MSLGSGVTPAWMLTQDPSVICAHVGHKFNRWYGFLALDDCLIRRRNCSRCHGHELEWPDGKTEWHPNHQ